MNAWHDGLPGKKCLAIGHRGAAALQPQNTLRAFQAAIDLGVDAVEFDVRWTADRQLVVIHSDELAETTDGEGFVHEKSLADLRALDAGQGQRILTLDETLDFLKGKALLTVDLKVAGYEDQVVDTLLAHDVQDQALLCSLDRLTLQRMRARAPELTVAVSYPEDKGGASTKPYLAGVVRLAVALMRATMHLRIGAMMAGAGASWTMLYHKIVTPAVVSTVHNRGGFIGVWTPDTLPEIERLRKMGVDSITSNRPDLLVRALTEKARP